MVLDSSPPTPRDLPPVPSADPGSFPRSATTYRSLADFLRERPQRRRSRERDVGLRWRDGHALYRAAWIEDTGELYLVQLGATGDGGGHVELLAGGLDHARMEAAVAGWRQAQDRDDHSLEWLRDRMRGAPR
jgi:hypothetical protein